MLYAIIFTTFAILFPPEPYVCFYDGDVKLGCYGHSEITNIEGLLDLEKLEENI